MSSRPTRILHLEPHETLASLAKRYPHATIRWRCERTSRTKTLPISTLSAAESPCCLDGYIPR